MSKYTTEVRFVCENNSGLTESVGFADVDSVLTAAWNKIFTTTCEFFDEEYRSVLCRKILKHYYTREICCETVGLWKLWMNTRLEEVMPYFNQLYKSALLDFEPFNDVNVQTTHKGSGTSAKTGENSGSIGRTLTEDITDKETTKDTGTGSETEEKSSTTDNTRTDALQSTTSGSGTTSDTDTFSQSKWDLYSDTPQGSVKNLENNSYLTNARKITDSTSDQKKGTSSAESTTKDTGTQKNSGVGSENNSKSYTNNKESTKNYTRDRDVTDNTTSTGNNSENVNSTDEYLESILGKRGNLTYSEMLEKYRNTFLNIDMQVINSFEDLFFGLW